MLHVPGTSPAAGDSNVQQELCACTCRNIHVFLTNNTVLFRQKRCTLHVRVHVTVHEISGSYITCYSCFVQVFQEYFKEMEEESIRDNFVIIYELMDELMDYGYPQTTESKILKE